MPAVLDINSLFTPAPSGVTPGNPGLTPAAGSWLSQLLAFANTLQLPTTSWESGGAVRTIMAIAAQALSQEDALISLMAQGGFLDYAATGTVTTTALNGTTTTQPVTPDPSIPSQNSTGALGWLDALANSLYNVQRIAATYASGTIAVANTTASVLGPYAAGTFHIVNPTTLATYSNTSSLTIAAQNLVGSGITLASNASPITITTSAAHGLASSNLVQIAGVTGNTAANGIWAITVVDTTHFTLTGSTGNGAYVSGGTVNVCTAATFAADVAGTGGSSAGNTINTLVTTVNGVSVSNPSAVAGANWESNTALAARCRLKLQSLSPNGPSGAYKYFALSASQLLAAQNPPVTLSAPITRVLVQSSPATGVVTVTVANAGGAVSGVSGLAVTGATNASPIQITTASPHGLSNGNYVTISGVLGNTNANGTFAVANASGSTFTLNGTTGNANYTGGGTVDGGDLGEVDAIIQANAVPTDVTAVTQSAVNFGVAVVATVTVPQAQVAAYQAAVQTALTSYLSTFPIGGVGTGVINYGDVVGVLYQAGSINGQPSYVVSVTGATVNSGTSDVTLPGVNYVAVLSPSPAAITVLGV